MASWVAPVFKPTVVGVGIGRPVLSTNRIRSQKLMKVRLLNVMPVMKLRNCELKRISLSRMTAF